MQHRLTLPRLLATAAALLLAACDDGGVGPSHIPGAEARYTVTPLVPALGGTGSGWFHPAALNEHGVVAGNLTGSLGSVPAVWRDGQITLYAGTEGFPTDVSDAGTVLGFRPEGGVFLISGGTLTPVAGLEDATATGLLDDGTIVGHRLGETTRAFRWKDGALSWLDVPGEPWTEAVAVAAGGAVALNGIHQACVSLGGAPYCATVSRAFVLQGGQLTPLGSLGWNPAGGGEVLVPEFTQVVAVDLGDGGAVAGTVYVDVCSADYFSCSGRAQAFVWGAGQMRGLGPLPGTESSFAVAVNAAGHVLGGSFTPASDAQIRYFVWRDGAIIDLSAAAAAAGIDLETATDINDAGQVAGVGTRRATGERHGVILTPVP